MEAERAFSACGLFVTKLCTRLSDKTIDVPCFLRQIYLKKYFFVETAVNGITKNYLPHKNRHRFKLFRNYRQTLTIAFDSQK